MLELRGVTQNNSEFPPSLQAIYFAQYLSIAERGRQKDFIYITLKYNCFSCPDFHSSIFMHLHTISGLFAQVGAYLVESQFEQSNLGKST